MFENLFRKRFFIVHIVFTALVAVLLAKSVTSLVAHVVVEKLAASSNAGKRPPPSRAPSIIRDFTALANANIFEAKREIVIEDTNAGPSEVTPLQLTGEWWDAPKSSLRLRLVGTMAFSEPSLSLCSIVEEGAKTQADLYSSNMCDDVDLSSLSEDDLKLAGKPSPCSRIGEDAIVLRIEPERVYIQNVAENRIEYLGLNEPPAPGGAAPRVASAKSEDKVDGDDGIVKEAPNQYGVARSTVDDALNNLSSLATQARIVPAFEGGKPVGFKLFSIKPGSLYSKIGLQNGDVINRINGYEMSSPEKGLEVYQKLKDSSNVDLEIKRRGKPLKLGYTIR